MMICLRLLVSTLIPPPPLHTLAPPPRKTAHPLSREVGKVRFAKTQLLYCKNRAECTRRILNGDDLLDEPPSIDTKRQVEFGKPLFGKSSACISRSNSDCHPNLSVFSPIAAVEVKEERTCLHDAAPGFDGMSKSGLCASNAAGLAARFNAYIRAGSPPHALK